MKKKPLLLAAILTFTTPLYLPAANLYWDSNGATLGAGATPTGTWGTNTFWSTDLLGGLATGAWTTGNTAVFAAGTDATTSYTVTVTGTQSATGVTLEEGTVALSGGTLNLTGSGTYDVASGLLLTVGSAVTGTTGYSKTGAGRVVLTSTSSTITGAVSVTGGILEITASGAIGGTSAGAGDITLDGGTFRNSAIGGGITFLTANRGFAIGANGGTIDVPGSIANIQIYTSGKITGVGNTFTKSGPGVFRNTTPTSITFTKLVVTGGLYQAAADTIFGAVPGSFLSDAITLNGGGISVNAGVTFSANRGITLGAGGGTIDGASSPVVPGKITGAGALTKSGAGTLTLSGANDFSGGLAFNAGVINFNNNSAAGSGTITVAAAATEFKSTAVSVVLPNAIVLSSGANPKYYATSGNSLDQTGVISGSGALTRDDLGSGTVTLSGANTFSGGVSWTSRTLRLNNKQALGTGLFSIGGGSAPTTPPLTLTAASNLTGANAMANAVAINQDFTFAAVSSAQFTGAVTMAATRTVTVNSGVSLTFSGNFASSTAGLNKAGLGTLKLDGNNAFTGAVAISAGALTARHSNALGTTAGGVTVTSGAALEIEDFAGSVIIGSETLSLAGTGTGASTGALRNLSGSNTYGGAITLTAASRINADAGTLTVSGGVTGGGSALTVGGSGNVTVSTTGISGAGTALTKDGSGTLTLSAANTYTGVTTISAGVVSVATIGDGGVASGNLGSATNAPANLVFDGGTLQYTGATDSTDRNFTINTGKTATFDVTANNLTLTGASTATAGALTKIGVGTLTLSGASANTYTGLTTVSAGEMDLNKTATFNAIGADATVSGGTLKWLASEQMGNSSSLILNSGTVDLNGKTETVGTFINNGGTFSTGVGGHLIGTGATITYNGGTNTINADAIVEDGHIVVSGGANVIVQGLAGTPAGTTAGGILQLNGSGTGLEMTGSTITLNSDATSAGKLALNGNVTTFASATSSNIANSGADAVKGTVDLGGSRTFTVADGAAAIDLNITAQIVNGGLIKGGAGLLNLSGASTYSSFTAIDAGTLTVSGPAGTAGTGTIYVGNGGTTGTAATLLADGGATISNTVSINPGNGTSRIIGGMNTTGTTTYSGLVQMDGSFGENRSTTLTSSPGGTVLYSNTISGAGQNVTVSGGGITLFTGANTYSGTTTVSAGTLQIGNGGTTGTLGSGAVTDNATLEFKRSNSYTVSNAISGSGAVVQSGSGKTVLTGTNTFTGATTISAGTLEAAVVGSLGGTSGVAIATGGTLLLSSAGNNDRINNAAGITLNGGTLGLSRAASETVSEGSGGVNNGGVFSGTNAVGLGALTLSANSTLDFGTGGVGTLTFSTFAPGSFDLNILNYTSTASGYNLNQSGVDGTDDRLIFNFDASSFLNQIRFGGVGAAQISLDSGYYEIVPVPEPTSVATVMGLLGLVGWRERRKARLSRAAERRVVG